MAHYCLHKFGMLPSVFLSLPRAEQAFIAASVKLRLERCDGTSRR